MNPIGCNSNQLKDIMVFCGYDYLSISDNKKLFFLSNQKNQIKRTTNKNKDKKYKKKVKENEIKKDPNSPFAVLEKLL